ncbi:lantibiotic dehydratase, partial [Enterococcus faecalis]|nr:lantibiotic dehydratase [Enterococcus faecalis]
MIVSNQFYVRETRIPVTDIKYVNNLSTIDNIAEYDEFILIIDMLEFCNYALYQSIIKLGSLKEKKKRNVLKSFKSSAKRMATIPALNAYNSLIYPASFQSVSKFEQEKKQINSRKVELHHSWINNLNIYILKNKKFNRRSLLVEINQNVEIYPKKIYLKAGGNPLADNSLKVLDRSIGLDTIFGVFKKKRTISFEHLIDNLIENKCFSNKIEDYILNLILSGFLITNLSIMNCGERLFKSIISVVCDINLTNQLLEIDQLIEECNVFFEKEKVYLIESKMSKIVNAENYLFYLMISNNELTVPDIYRGFINRFLDIIVGIKMLEFSDGCSMLEELFLEEFGLGNCISLETLFHWIDVIGNYRDLNVKRRESRSKKINEYCLSKYRGNSIDIEEDFYYFFYEELANFNLLQSFDVVLKISERFDMVEYVSCTLGARSLTNRFYHLLSDKRKKSLDNEFIKCNNFKDLKKINTELSCINPTLSIENLKSSWDKVDFKVNLNGFSIGDNTLEIKDLLIYHDGKDFHLYSKSKQAEINYIKTSAVNPECFKLEEYKILTYIFEKKYRYLAIDWDNIFKCPDNNELIPEVKYKDHIVRNAKYRLNRHELNLENLELFLESMYKFLNRNDLNINQPMYYYQIYKRKRLIHFYDLEDMAIVYNDLVNNLNMLNVFFEKVGLIFENNVLLGNTQKEAIFSVFQNNIGIRKNKIPIYSDSSMRYQVLEKFVCIYVYLPYYLEEEYLYSLLECEGIEFYYVRYISNGRHIRVRFSDINDEKLKKILNITKKYSKYKSEITTFHPEYSRYGGKEIFESIMFYIFVQDSEYSILNSSSNKNSEYKENVIIEITLLLIIAESKKNFFLMYQCN